MYVFSLDIRCAVTSKWNFFTDSISGGRKKGIVGNYLLTWFLTAILLTECAVKS